MRGNHAIDHATGSGWRSIPAHAGEPGRSVRARPTMRVYPRACGGTWGLRSTQRSFGGSIPAHAGEPRYPRTGRGTRRVYPRACGGTAILKRDAMLDALRRVYPRACGGTTKPFDRTTTGCARRVYPRACGGTRVYRHRHVRAPGLSPRMRGNRMPSGDSSNVPSTVYPRACGGTDSTRRSLRRHDLERSIPAHAGEPQVQPFEFRMHQPGLSPRMRGNPDRSGIDAAIPAHAGEP